MNIEDIKISGVTFNYYFICKRKMYLFSKGIQFEEWNEDVQIGKSVEEVFYSGKQKNFQFQKINIDMLQEGLVVSEIKKSRKMLESDELQVKYYLFVLTRMYQIEVNSGYLHYPLLNIKKEVHINDEDVLFIDKSLTEIEEILSSKSCPEKINIHFCEKCSYFEFCYI